MLYLMKTKTLSELEQEMLAARVAFEALPDPDSTEADEAWRTMYAAEQAYKRALENRTATRYETWMD